MAHAARLIVIPGSRFHPDFFQLRTRRADEMLQKFVSYRLRLCDHRRFLGGYFQ